MKQITTHEEVRAVEYGSFLRAECKDARTVEGVLTLCWHCLDELAYELAGVERSVFPQMGDRVFVVRTADEQRKLEKGGQ